MVSRSITAGVGIPMIVVGALMAILWAPNEGNMQSLVEFVGSLIGVLGVAFFIAGLFYAKEPTLR